MTNDQESIIELITESALGFENAFAEFDNDDGNEIQKKVGKQSLIYHFQPVSAVTFYKPYTISQYQDYSVTYISPALIDSLSPPPECG